MNTIRVEIMVYKGQLLEKLKTSSIFQENPRQKGVPTP